ncbi:MAG: hypothetical protein KC544_12200 [Gemmatimonadetes bacterium]|nr:hypothetical protein [Gemmatimonadota bacterium]
MTTLSQRLLMATCLLSPAAVAAQRCAAPAASYHVRWLGADRFGVEARFAVPTARLALRFSEAIGRPEAQAASVVALEGWRGDAAAAVAYRGEGTWTSARPLTRVRYEVVADHDAVEWTGGGIDEVASHFGDTYFFVGNAFFLHDADWPSCPIEIAFDLPEDWSILSPWPGGPRSFHASDVAHLEKNAFAMGRFTAGATDAGTMTLQWVLDERLASIAPVLVPMMTRLPPVFADYFGATPAERYAVVVFKGPRMDGGAFRESFTLTLADPVRAIDALVWTHGLAHEMLHLWLGNHVRGANPAEASWFTEGFTDYLAITLGYRAGLFETPMLAQRLANVIRRVRLAPRLSPGVGLVEAGREKSDHWERIYGGGAMVALLIDAADHDGFVAALRDLVAHADAPVTQAGLLATLDAHTDGLGTRAFALVDAGGDFGAIIAWLGRAGVEVTGFSPDEVYVRFAGACEADACLPSFVRR